ncbi:hypothetical protein PHLCEN_2v5536 [Hermanssonia centrifuga]|uniref:Uncharacterized protein n=1 Tax=Hermanssonia centrifuga TaxID=98765 RepID=A0A2R6P253_9APHY|nr:hypothetical protein PHLCEN_2v5536 [Hermanssonia centrifuga]
MDTKDLTFAFGDRFGSDLEKHIPRMHLQYTALVNVNLRVDFISVTFQYAMLADPSLRGVRQDIKNWSGWKVDSG